MRQYEAPSFESSNAISKSIMVVDANTITPYAIDKLLSRYPSITVVGHSNDSVEALNLCRKLLPDIVIIDPRLSGFDCLSMIKQLRRINTDVSVIVYGFESQIISIADYIKHRVNAIILKNSPLTSLLKGIFEVINGREFLDAEISDLYYKGREKADNKLALPQLSPREALVLKMIAEGKRNKDIARILSVSVKTVESHRLNTMKKLNAHSTLELARWAKRLNVSDFL